MKTVADLSKIISDQNNLITEWVCRNLGYKTNWLQNYHTFGVVRNNKIIAGLIFHDVHINDDVSWTIYSTDKHWCTKKIIKFFMREAFEYLGCRRINILVNTDNDKCLKFVTGLGFKKEGLLRQFRENGQDCYILGLLKSENKYK